MADITIDGITIGANRFLLLDSTGKIPAVDGSQVTAIAAGNIATGTIPIARIDTGTTANKIVQLDGNAKLPALDGSLLTNVSSSTKSASDPTISTNPSGGVGTEWHNKTTGQMYICTDATAGANIWTNVGAGSGDVVPYLFQGTAFGYSAGGYATPSMINNICKFSFTADANATDVGDLSGLRSGPSASHSSTYGYVMGGYVGPETNIIEKVSFSTDGNMVDVGDLLTNSNHGVGCSSSTYGYHVGGFNGSAYTNVIQKLSWSAEGNSSDVAALLAVLGRQDNSSSTTHGYTAGGRNGNPVNTIQKFPFATDSNSTDVGDLLAATKEGCGGVNSSTHGYHCQGYLTGTTMQDRIEKYTFASDANSTDVGNATSVAILSTGSSSTTYGYLSGGDPSGYSPRNIIEKFSFTTDGNATDIADLTHLVNVAARGGMQI